MPYSFSVFSTATKALWGIWTRPPFSCVFAGLLFFQEFAFPRDVAAVALGGDVFPKGADGGAGDDLAAHGPLDGDLELLFGDFILEAVADPDAPLPDPVLVDDHGQGVQLLAVHQDVEL